MREWQKLSQYDHGMKKLNEIKGTYLYVILNTYVYVPHNNYVHVLQNTYVYVIQNIYVHVLRKNWKQLVNILDIIFT